MASASLASSPPAPVVLDKNMTESELAGDERSSNILMQFSSFRAVARHACLCFLVLTMNFRLQSHRPLVTPPPQRTSACCTAIGVSHHFAFMFVETCCLCVCALDGSMAELLPLGGADARICDVSDTPISVLWLLPLPVTSLYCRVENIQCPSTCLWSNRVCLLDCEQDQMMTGVSPPITPIKHAWVPVIVPVITSNQAAVPSFCWF